MPKGILFKNIGLYLISVVVLTYYGIEVCPFLDQIDVYELIVEMSVGLGLVQLAKVGICSLMPTADEGDLDQQMRVKCAFDAEGRLNPGKVFPSLHRCAELGEMHVHNGELPFPDLPRF